MGKASASKESRFDRERIEADLRRRHGWAKLLAPGKLSLIAVYSDPDKPERTDDRIAIFNPEIGDVEASVKFVMGYEDNPNWNVFTGLCAFRSDLPRTKKPEVADCIGVFGLIADHDDDHAEQVNQRISEPPTFEINSSPGNYQLAYIFEAPLAYAEAKAMAENLRTASGTDTPTSDAIHVWRIDGTLNWPTYKKVQRGRARDPFPVRIVASANFDSLYPVTALQATLTYHAEKASKPKDDGASRQRDGASLYAQLKLATQTLIRTVPDAAMDRSAVCMVIIKDLIRAGYSGDEQSSIYDLYPNGPFSHYRDRIGFLDDVANIRRKTGAERARGTGARTKGPVAERLIVTNMAGVELKPISWLWPERIAVGKLSLIAGHPDLGKSLTTLDLSARVTRGMEWPDKKGSAPLGNVILLSAEDDPADTYGPRLKAMGADLSRIDAIMMVEAIDPDSKGVRGFDVQQDIERLERLATEKEAKLIVIDPVSAYMGKPGKVDTHRNTDVRAILAPLKDMAERSRCAVLLVSHLTKAGGTEALQRVTGSGAFIAAVRAGFMVEKDESDGAAPGRRLVLPLKNNLSADRTGLAYKIATRDVDCVGMVPVIEWENGSITITADQALAAKAKYDRRGFTPAANFLREYLSDGPREATVVESAAAERGITPAQLKTARARVGVVTAKDGFQGKWTWALAQRRMPF
jgi:hypothetical protein